MALRLVSDLGSDSGGQNRITRMGVGERKDVGAIAVAQKNIVHVQQDFGRGKVCAVSEGLINFTGDAPGNKDEDLLFVLHVPV